MAWARYWSRRRPADSGAAVKACVLFLGFVLDLEDGDDGRCCGLDAAGGAVLRLDRAAALALGEHVFRRHERRPFAVAARGVQQ